MICVVNYQLSPQVKGASCAKRTAPSTEMATPSGWVPARQVADIRETDGPNQILRENARRRIVVQANTDGGSDMATIVAAIREAVARFGSAVAKPLYSTKARGMEVWQASDSDLDTKIRAFQKTNPMMYVQQKLDLSGQDLGMVFLGGEYLCTYARVAAGDTWNTTIHSGGKYAAYDPDARLIQLADNAQEPFAMDFTTVDVALTADGPVVFEVSAFGGFRGALEGAGVDAASAYAEYALSAVQSALDT